MADIECWDGADERGESTGGHCSVAVDGTCIYVLE